MALRAAADIDDAPSIIRFPKGTVGDPIVARRQVGGVDVLVEPDDGDVDVLIVGIGSMVATALAVGDKLTAEGLRVRVIDPVWALPVPSALTGLAGTARRVAVVEDGSVAGGIGSQVAYAVRQAGLDVPVDIFGLPREFLDHGSRGQVLEASGLTADAIVTSLRSRLA
jgi:1-deoxy-D-xylulose-5-phosphate synthase